MILYDSTECGKLYAQLESACSIIIGQRRGILGISRKRYDGNNEAAGKAARLNPLECSR